MTLSAVSEAKRTLSITLLALPPEEVPLPPQSKESVNFPLWILGTLSLYSKYKSLE